MQSVSEALDRALAAVALRPQDGAAVALARRYAAAVDEVDADPDVLAKVGARLLDVLVELGMTPKARAGVVRGGGDRGGAARSTLDELRDRRKRRAASVDTAAT